MKPSTVLWAVSFSFLFVPTVFAQLSPFESALQQAKEEDKGVAIYFHADAYQAPESLEEVMPDDWIIKAYLDRNYVTVSIDADTEQGSEIADRYAPLGVYPALALATNDGEFKGVQTFISDIEDAGEWAHFFLMFELKTGEQENDAR